MDHSAIYNEALMFRKAILAALNSGIDLGIQFEAFPRGACGDTCILLGAYLDEQGLGQFNHMVGVAPKYEFYSHAWLEKDGLLVDITADQFSGINEEVIVSFKHSFYDRFYESQENEPTIQRVLCRSSLEGDALNWVYDEICNFIE
jgi:hypothetical protein